MEVLQSEDGFLSEVKQNKQRDDFADWWQSYLKGSVRPNTDFKDTIEIVDLFCGAGGFGLGAQLAGSCFQKLSEFRCIVDADTEALEVYRNNLSVKNILNKSVADLIDYRISIRGERASFAYEPVILDKVLDSARNTDLLIAGPPCQGHSNLNNFTRRNDPRNDLYVATATIAVALNVSGLIIENVPTVRSAHGDVVKIAESILQASGYAVASTILKLDYLGGPQTRSRHFLIAIKDTGKFENFQTYINDYAETFQRKALPVTWAISDLNENHGNSVFDTPPKATAETQRRIDWMFENNKYNLDNSERPDCHKNGTTYTAVYGRMYDNKPASTLTTGIGTPGQGRFIHPKYRRLITPHEAARIQCFPDTYSFVTKSKPEARGKLNKWIGDAVPSMLGLYPCIMALEAILGSSPKYPWIAQ